MRSLFIILSLITFISCKKTDVAQELPAQIKVEFKTLSENLTAPQRNIVTVTEPYNSFIFDSCRQENVILTGTITYFTEIIRRQDETVIVVYNIDLTDVIGIGEFTGTVYKGDGTMRTNSQYAESDVRGTVRLRLKYVADNGNRFEVWEHAVGIFKNERYIVQFHSMSYSCK